jgi:hypothetical protein
MVVATRNYVEPASMISQTFEAVTERNILQNEARRLWNGLDLNA